MFKRIHDRNIWLIYQATLLLGIAYGVSIALTALHLDARGFSKQDIGSLAAWFAAGLVALSLPMGTLIRWFSAKTILTIAIVGYAVCVSTFPFLHSYAAIATARFFDGAFSISVWISCETILLTRSESNQKAYVTSLYAIAIAVGYVLGPLVAKVIIALAPMPIAFLCSGVIATASALLVATKLERDGPVDHRSVLSGSDTYPQMSPTRTAASALLWRIKTSCFATFAYGYFQASVVLFLPLYLIETKGIPRERTILIPAFFAAGMLLFSNYAGKLGDKYGHLLTMRALATIGMVMVIGFVFLHSYWLMCITVFVAGASLASISPVSLALQGVITNPIDYSRSNAIYNVFYAAGILLGPPVSSALYGHWGGITMLYHLAALWGIFIAFSLIFSQDDPARRAGGQGPPPMQGSIDPYAPDGRYPSAT